MVAGFVADLGLEDIAAGESEVAEVLGHQLHTGVGLLVQAPIRVGEYRIVAVERADTQFILGETHLERRAQHTELVSRLAVVQRKHAAGVAALVILVVEVATGVQLQSIERLQVQAKTHRAFGVAGLEVELEPLAPITNAVGLGVAVHHITPLLVQVAIEQGHIGVAVIDKVGVGGQHKARHGGTHHRAYQRLHCYRSPSLC